MLLRIFRLLKLLVLSPFFYLFYLYSKLIHHKYHEILSDRIGHHIMDGTNKIFQTSLFTENEKIAYFQLYEPINKQWQKMLERRLGLIKNFSMFEPHIRRFKFSQDVFIRSNDEKLDVYGRYYTSNVTLPVFTEPEETQGLKWLESHGISSTDRIVCILIRDDKYLQNAKQFSSYRHDHHSYRDTDSDDYVNAINYLLEKGFVVVRMGRNMNKPIKIHHKHFIDYAFDDQRSDLLDIWLFANARHIIATGTGPDILANVCKIPILYVNFIPLINIHSFHHSLTFPKHLFWAETGERLRLEDYLNYGFSLTSDYQKMGIVVKDMTPTEILLATKEYIHRLENAPKHRASESTTQELFWNQMKNSKKHVKLRPWQHKDAAVCDCWLQMQNKNFFSTVNSAIDNAS